MKKFVLIGLIMYLIIIGFLWFQVFNLSGIFWWERKAHYPSGKEFPIAPELLLPPTQSINIKEKIQEIERPKLQRIKDQRAYAIKCECGACQDVLAECHGGMLCPTARKQIKELGIKL